MRQKSKIWSGKWVVSLLKHEFRVRKGSSLFLLYCFGVGIFLILIMSTRQRAFLLNLVFSVCHAQVNTKIISIQLFTCGVEIANTNHEREIRMKYFQRARCSHESEILSCGLVSSILSSLSLSKNRALTQYFAFSTEIFSQFIIYKWIDMNTLEESSLLWIVHQPLWVAVACSYHHIMFITSTFLMASGHVIFWQFAFKYACSSTKSLVIVCKTKEEGWSVGKKQVAIFGRNWGQSHIETVQ